MSRTNISKNLSRGRRRACTSLLLAGLLPALQPGTLRAQDGGGAPLKVGFVYVSPVGDAGWTYQHDIGRREMERLLGAQGLKVQTTVVENVPEGPDAERVLRDLAAQGHRLIFATSFGYLEPALKVARDFPGTVFEHAGGYKTAPNLGTYIGRFYEARYLAGVLAGASSHKGTAGYVAGFPVPEVVQGINAFTLGMRSVNPEARVKVIWLDAWFDPAREREAAQALMQQGADVLTHHSGSSAVSAAVQMTRSPTANRGGRSRRRARHPLPQRHEPRGPARPTGCHRPRLGRLLRCHRASRAAGPLGEHAGVGPHE